MVALHVCQFSVLCGSWFLLVDLCCSSLSVLCSENLENEQEALDDLTARGSVVILSRGRISLQGQNLEHPGSGIWACSSEFSVQDYSQ